MERSLGLEKGTREFSSLIALSEPPLDADQGSARIWLSLPIHAALLNRSATNNTALDDGPAIPRERKCKSASLERRILVDRAGEKALGEEI
jgi:hypothetical protein